MIGDGPGWWNNVVPETWRRSRIAVITEQVNCKTLKNYLQRNEYKYFKC